MTYRLELSPRVLRQLAGLPMPVHYALVAAMSVVVEDPYDPTTTEPTEVPEVREAVFDDAGIVQFQVWDDLLVVVALNLIWSG